MKALVCSIFFISLGGFMSLCNAQNLLCPKYKPSTCKSNYENATGIIVNDRSTCTEQTPSDYVNEYDFDYPIEDGNVVSIPKKANSSYQLSVSKELIQTEYSCYIKVKPSSLYLQRSEGRLLCSTGSKWSCNSQSGKVVCACKSSAAR